MCAKVFEWFSFSSELTYLHDSKGKIIGRVRKNYSDYSAAVGAKSLGSYISEEFAKQAVEESISKGESISNSGEDVWVS